MSERREGEGWLRFHPNTALAVGFAAFFVFGFGMVRTVVLDVPFPPRGAGDVGLLLYGLALVGIYLVALFVTTEPCVSVDTGGAGPVSLQQRQLAGSPGIISPSGGRFTDWTFLKKRAS